MMSLECIRIPIYDLKTIHKVQGDALCCLLKLRIIITNWELKKKNLNIPKSLSPQNKQIRILILMCDHINVHMVFN